MTSEIYEKEFNSGVIEYKGRPIVKLVKYKLQKLNLNLRELNIYL